MSSTSPSISCGSIRRAGRRARSSRSSSDCSRAAGGRRRESPCTAGRDDIFATCERRAARYAVDAPRYGAAVHCAGAHGRSPHRTRCVRREGHRRGDDLRGGTSARRVSSGGAAVRRRRRDVSRRCARRERRAIERGLVPATSRALINGEPTESRLALGTKGAVRMTVRTEGRAAHSAYPHLRSLGDDAASCACLSELETIDAAAVIRCSGKRRSTSACCRAASRTTWSRRRRRRALMARLVGPVDDVVSAVTRWVGDRGTVDVGVSIPASAPRRRSPASRRRSSRSRRTFPRSRGGARRICSVPARSTSRTATTSSSTSPSSSRRRHVRDDRPRSGARTACDVRRSSDAS